MAEFPKRIYCEEWMDFNDPHQNKNKILLTICYPTVCVPKVHLCNNLIILQKIVQIDEFCFLFLSTICTCTHVCMFQFLRKYNMHTYYYYYIT